MTVMTLNDLFLETLKDLYYAEKKLVQTLPKMAKKATSPTLKEAIERHLGETETQDQVEALQGRDHSSCEEESAGTKARLGGRGRAHRPVCSFCARTIDNHRFPSVTTATIGFAHRGHVWSFVANGAL